MTRGKTLKKKSVNSAAHSSKTKAESYRHLEAKGVARPDVGTQAQFRKKKPPVKYRYDSSLSPSMEWDGTNPARELGEWLVRIAQQASKLPTPHIFSSPQEFKSSDGRVLVSIKSLQEALEELQRIAKPFLNWSGRAERLSFDVPTLPLFIHERLSTKAIIETLKGHKRDLEKGQKTFFGLWADPQRPIADQVLKAYEYKDEWVNRLILGDSLVVMNSLLHYEGMGGQVQVIYIDPPYGVKFGSNFQPFVRKRDVQHNEDDDMTREPEMVQAYRDTWELGVHSYLTYLRDRLLIARDLLHHTGSIFVQISDENLHHVRELMDDIFGSDNFVSQISFSKASGGLQAADRVGTILDYIVWYAKDRDSLKYHAVFEKKDEPASAGCAKLELANGSRRSMTKEEKETGIFPAGSKPYGTVLMTKPGPGSKFTVEYKGRKYDSGNRWWGTTPEGIKKIIELNRVEATENSIRFVSYYDDFPYRAISNLWSGFGGAPDPIYVVQTNQMIIQRCILMTTDPGDLVLDPTCGSGTTAFVSEQWGRRWITIDTSRVPLALARQRLLTATFPYYELQDESRGPIGGFVYKRKQNRKGEEIGGIVPHVTLKSIANDESPEEEVLVDRSEETNSITRVSGPFCVEATIPTPVDWEGHGIEDSGANQESHGAFVDRMIEVLRKSPVLRLEGNKSVLLKNIRIPAKTLCLSAEAYVDATAPGQKPTLNDAIQESLEKSGKSLPFSQKPIAIVFGPENGAVSEKLVYEAAREAHAKSYSHLYVVGFAIQSTASQLIEKSEDMGMVPVTYIQATPDLMMGDLLKNMRSSQIFSVCGKPEIKITKSKTGYSVKLLGLDSFDPITMETLHKSGEDVPAWFLDTDYNGLCFHVSQAFFPRTSAWENLKKALKGTYDETVWDHLAGSESAPFELGEHRQIAVKVIDDRGNELLIVKLLDEVR